MSWSDWAGPVVYTLGLWWLSTGVILYLDGLNRRTFRTTMTVATVLLALALAGLVHTRDAVGATGAYCAFTCALLVWAWQELAFLLGIVTGPNRMPSPPGVAGWQRTRLAFAAVLHHELALVVLALAVWLAVGDGANRTGWWTFLALWVMRQSAKLNLFLGARNLSESFLPDHLKYMHSHFRRRAMNPLFPVSIAGTSLAAWWVWQQVAELPTGSPALAGLALVGTLLALGVLEHALLVLPLPPEALWRWGLSSHINSGLPTAAHGSDTSAGLARRGRVGKGGGPAPGKSAGSGNHGGTHHHSMGHAVVVVPDSNLALNALPLPPSRNPP